MHVITIAPFTASNALDGAFLKVIPQAYLTAARNLLKPHNIAIELLRTGFGGVPCVVTWPKAVDDEKDGGSLRKLCEDTTDTLIGSSIPVIFGMGAPCASPPAGGIRFSYHATSTSTPLAASAPIQIASRLIQALRSSAKPTQR